MASHRPFSLNCPIQSQASYTESEELEYPSNNLTNNKSTLPESIRIWPRANAIYPTLPDLSRAIESIISDLDKILAIDFFACY
jgi:hypothetical protein